MQHKIKQQKGDPMAKKLTVAHIRSQIKAAGYDWKVGQTPLSRLSEDEQDMRLGLDVPKDEMERIEVALSREVKAFTFAPQRDWRDKDGKNWVTLVQDQGACGSCVAFGTVATIECQARIQSANPSLDIDLSEADLFFCGAGRNCQTGWWPTYALDYAKNEGISEEGCFEYEDRDMDCNLCSNKADRLIKIGSWQEIINIGQRKEWLDQKGPMVACMAVYRDFFGYLDGVYRHVTGDLAGYHAVSCIGYSEEEECWICKNSWGPGWGKEGFFKIGYGEADMDTRFAMYGVEELAGPLLEEEEEEGCELAEYVAVDYSFTANRRVLWAYVGGKWRYRLVSDAQLAGLGSILVGSKPIRACYTGDELTRIVAYNKVATS
jgi:hypothetical protein